MPAGHTVEDVVTVISVELGRIMQDIAKVGHTRVTTIRIPKLAFVIVVSNYEVVNTSIPIPEPSQFANNTETQKARQHYFKLLK